jgi:hypothetical protein
MYINNTETGSAERKAHIYIKNREKGFAEKQVLISTYIAKRQIFCSKYITIFINNR